MIKNLLATLNKIFFLLPKGDALKLFVLFNMMLFASLFEVIGIGMIPIFVSIIADPSSVLQNKFLLNYFVIFNIKTGEDLLLYGSLLLILVFIIKNLYVTFFKYIKSRYVWSRFGIISNNLFTKYMRAPYEFHLNNSSSELLRNVTQETQHLAVFVMIPILTIMMEFVIVSGIIGLLLIVEPLITVGVVVLLLSIGLGFLRIIRDKTKVYGKQAQEDRGNIILTIQEGLGGIKDTKILGREIWFEKGLKAHLKRFTKSQSFREVSSQTSQPVMETVAVIGMMGIALLLFWQGRSLTIIVPILALFGTATVRLLPSIQHIVQHWTNLRYYLHTIHPIYNDLKILSTKSLEENSSEIKLKFNESISFERVIYHYPNTTTKVVNDLSFSISRGQAIGLVGASGSGKTTTIDLLLGLLDPISGSVLVDSTNINSHKRSWQNNIGYIPQQIYLQDASIRQNIGFGLPFDMIDENKIINAVKWSNLDELVNELPYGLDTITGEGGIRLSGGQRQRIGIARALYHNPSVLVMDEATSALDNVTESIIMEAINRLKGERTVIMIAHRITTVKNCDVIFFMEKGKIISTGSYEELLKNSSKFRYLAMDNGQ